MEVNLRGYFWSTVQAARRMKARGTGGCIVNIGSVAGRIARPLSSVYDSTKHALEALTDGQREADEDNLGGYYEFERVKKVADDPTWLQEAAQSAAMRRWVADGVESGGRALLERRLGRPADLLPPDAPPRRPPRD